MFGPVLAERRLSSLKPIDLNRLDDEVIDEIITSGKARPSPKHVDPGRAPLRCIASSRRNRDGLRRLEDDARIAGDRATYPKYLEESFWIAHVEQLNRPMPTATGMYPERIRSWLISDIAVIPANELRAWSIGASRTTPIPIQSRTPYG